MKYFTNHDKTVYFPLKTGTNMIYLEVKMEEIIGTLAIRLPQGTHLSVVLAKCKDKEDAKRQIKGIAEKVWD